MGAGASTTSSKTQLIKNKIREQRLASYNDDARSGMPRQDVVLLAPLVSLMCPDLPGTDTTYTLPYYDEDVDEVAWDYHKALMEDVFDSQNTLVVPLRTTGDGSCLLHATSRFLYGLELFSDMLRARVAKEIGDNMGWYTEKVGKSDADEAHRQAKNPYEFLGTIHIIALAHVLRRPIMLFASKRDIEMFGCGYWGCAGIFPPIRFSPADCVRNPVIIGWGSQHRDHFVPLVWCTGTAQPRLPILHGSDAVPDPFKINSLIDRYISPSTWEVNTKAPDLILETVMELRALENQIEHTVLSSGVDNAFEGLKNWRDLNNNWVRKKVKGDATAPRTVSVARPKRVKHKVAGKEYDYLMDLKLRGKVKKNVGINDDDCAFERAYALVKGSAPKAAASDGGARVPAEDVREVAETIIERRRKMRFENVVTEAIKRDKREIQHMSRSSVDNKVSNVAQALSLTTALMRLSSEALLLSLSPIGGVECGPRAGEGPPDLLYWTGSVTAPRGCLWEGQVYKIAIEFDHEYPIKPPRMLRVITPIFHPNISNAGVPNIGVFGDNGDWLYLWGVSTVLNALLCLFRSPDTSTRISNTEARSMLLSDKSGFKKRAAAIHATPPSALDSFVMSSIREDDFELRPATSRAATAASLKTQGSSTRSLG